LGASESHHVRFAQKLAFGRKVSDEFTVPLCRLHHRELHRSRNEPLWWNTARIDPIPIARELWEATRPKLNLNLSQQNRRQPQVPGQLCRSQPTRRRKGALRRRAELHRTLGPSRTAHDVPPPKSRRTATTRSRARARRPKRENGGPGLTPSGTDSPPRRSSSHWSILSEEYRSFEDAIVAEYLPQTPVEQELVHRLASPFWRLRRATSIETGLLRMQGEILRAFQSSPLQNADSSGEGACRVLGSTGAGIREDAVCGANEDHELQPQSGRLHVANVSRDIAISFLRLTNLNSDIVDRLSGV
jgi:hypothetical protein